MADDIPLRSDANQPGDEKDPPDIEIVTPEKSDVGNPRLENQMEALTAFISSEEFATCTGGAIFDFLSGHHNYTSSMKGNGPRFRIFAKSIIEKLLRSQAIAFPIPSPEFNEGIPASKKSSDRLRFHEWWNSFEEKALTICRQLLREELPKRRVIKVESSPTNVDTLTTSRARTSLNTKCRLMLLTQDDSAIKIFHQIFAGTSAEVERQSMEISSDRVINLWKRLADIINDPNWKPEHALLSRRADFANINVTMTPDPPYNENTLREDFNNIRAQCTRLFSEVDQSGNSKPGIELEDEVWRNFLRHKDLHLFFAFCLWEGLLPDYVDRRLPEALRQDCGVSVGTRDQAAITSPRGSALALAAKQVAPKNKRPSASTGGTSVTKKAMIKPGLGDQLQITDGADQSHVNEMVESLVNHRKNMSRAEMILQYIERAQNPVTEDEKTADATLRELLGIPPRQSTIADP